MEKTNEKIIVFYRAEYPDIDPNIVYTYEELIGEGYYIGTKDVSQFEDETKYHFGIPVRLKVKEFDYDKIKDDYSFYRRPWVQNRSKYTTIFTDGQTSVAIKKQQILQYIKVVERELYVYQKHEICRVHSNQTKDFLCKIFLRLNSYIPKEKECYRMSYNMITELEDYDEEVSVLQHYDANKPNIFFTIVDSESSQ